MPQQGKSLFCNRVNAGNMQDINIPLIIIVVIVLIALLFFLNWRNRRDQKKLFPPESTDPVEENKTEKEIRRDIS